MASAPHIGNSIIPYESLLRTAFLGLPVILFASVIYLLYRLHNNKTAWAVSVVCLALLVRAIFDKGPPFVESIMNNSNMPITPTHRRSRTAKNASAGFVAAANLHSDALMWARRDLLTKSKIGHVDLPRLHEGNVRLQVFAMVIAVPSGMNMYSNPRPKSLLHDIMFLKMILERWPVATWTSHLHRALFQCERLHTLAAASTGRLVVTTSADQITPLLHTPNITPDQTHSTNAILALEGASALENNIQNVDILFAAGLRVLGPVHFYDTEVGGSRSGIAKYGLTAFGRSVIKRMHELGMIVDLAHASDGLIEDITSIPELERPCVLLSHTGVSRICPSPRNVDDEHLRMIASINGLIGITLFYPALCDPDNLIGNFVKSVVHAIATVGVDHIALGSDFDGCVHTSVDASDMRVLYSALVHEGGLTEEEANAVLFGNAVNFFQRCLPQ